MEPLHITKRFTFEMAHALRGYDGPCRHIHGHSYALEVSVGGALGAVGAADEGMVMDFGALKTIVQQAVLERYDHALVLHTDERAAIPMDHPLFARTIFVAWQPTCENLLKDVVERIRHQLATDLRLAHARLHETATNWAEWSAAISR